MAKREVLIIGGGMAGLAAACELARGGCQVSILEARDRLGGRVHTIFDPGCDVPIELGAEFVHGYPPETWDLLRQGGIETAEVDGDNFCASETGMVPCDFFSGVDSILEKMSDSEPDQSFLAWINRYVDRDRDTQSAKQHAIDYVTGFNAADPNLVGVHWLVEGIRAEKRLDGERAFRAHGGYQTLLSFLLRQIERLGVTVHAGTIVEAVDWSSEEVRVRAHSSKGPVSFSGKHLLVTLPLAVLKARAGEVGRVEFAPALPREKIAAMEKLEMGKVIRVVLRFRRRFWEELSPAGGPKNLANLAFLFSQDEWFPTWWTGAPEPYPTITGWAPAHCAERLSNRDPSFVVQRALETLASLLSISKKEIEAYLESAHFHDWQSDPFSRGAYSYGKVGADGAQAALAAPLDGKLFFAGEATDITGNNGTVHAAIGSGYRAAAEILQAK